MAGENELTLPTIEVVVNRQVTDRAKLLDNPTNTAAPQVSGYTATSIGNGIVRYTASTPCTGSSQSNTIVISKPHRIVRIEFQQLVTSTLAPDTTGIVISIGRVNKIVNSSSSVTLLALPNTATDSVVLQLGQGWESDSGQYNLTWTGQNNDTLTQDYYVQYL